MPNDRDCGLSDDRRPWLSWPLWLALALALLAGLLGSPVADATPRQTTSVTIVRWHDGDTVEVTDRGGAVRVRLIGIDAPEASFGRRAARQAAELSRDEATVVALGRRARAAAERLAPQGTTVQIELDVRTHDRFGRLLAYVWLADGRMVNEELIRRGYAMVLTIPPNVRYADRFIRAQREAREHRRGLWAR